MVEFLFNFFIDPSTGDIVHDSFHHLFPIFQFSCYCTFLPISFLVLNQWVVKLQNVWIFLPSAVVSLNFFSRLHENLFSLCSPFLWWFFFFLSEVMMQSGLAMVPIFHTTFPSTSLMYSSKLLLSSKRYFSTSCWMEAVVGMEVSTANRTEYGKGNVAPLIVFVKQLYLNAVTPIHLRIIYGCSHAIRAHLSSY